MSLNGLDVNAVVEAHQTALADPGGWFLLKYANRDTVEVLNRGNGGVAECKGVVEQYAEKSPLYGMLQYRRKRVLLKYMPEGTSRLLQVRTSVQFQSVLDAFPHDTVFSFTAAPELVESALGQCTMLQPANMGSLQSSGSSMRQRRLNEISEDAEDMVMPVRRDEKTFARPEPVHDTIRSDGSDTSTLPASALRAKALLAKRKEENLALSQTGTAIFTHHAGPSQSYLDEPSPPAILPGPVRRLGSLDQLRLRSEADSTVSVYKADTDTPQSAPKLFHHSRHLSENESKNIAQWNEQVTEYVIPSPLPKKKLGPRPHVETQPRPKTANQYEDRHSVRPVANLPQSVRMSNRPNPHLLVRPGSQQSTRSVPTRFMPTMNFPPLPDFNQLQSLHLRPESRKAGSVVSSLGPDGSTASPEKMRLMKALQHRKRNQILTQRAASAQPSFARDGDDFPLGISSSSQIRPVAKLPTIIQEHTVRKSQEVKLVNDSSTASPTSIGTTSDDPSTRPSSYVEDQKSRVSQGSASNDTNSSSTPKAFPENGQTAFENRTVEDSLAPALNEKQARRERSTDETTSIDGKQVANNKVTTPRTKRTQTREGEPIGHDRSNMSWLASDSQLEMIQAIVQSADTNNASKHRTGEMLSIDTLVQPDNKEAVEISDDDESEVGELHEATVHEATPVSVKRPPLTPTMRTYSHDRSRATTKSTSSLTQSTRSTPSALEKSPGNSLHSLSTALPQWPPGTEDEPMAIPLVKKATLGHGISNRIKALEDSSRRASGISSSGSVHDSSVSRSTLSNITKRMSFMSQFQNPSQLSDKPQSTEGSKQPLAAPFTADKPVSARPVAYKQDTTSSKLQKKNGGQTQLGPPFTVNHIQETSNISGVNTPLLPDPNHSFLDTDPLASEKKRFSFASYRSGNSHRSASTAKWVQQESMASRVSLGRESRTSRKAVSEASSINDEKRASRASRLMKRISGFGTRSSGKLQQNASNMNEARPQPIMEQNENTPHRGSIASSVMQMIDVGDVNVQFPEALLWKRRFLRIDDQGYLVFTAPTGDTSGRTTNRKFHLADVQEPCLPDSEREEIAWSVLLDLRDGNCIQCACESKQGQTKVLKMLLDAHGAYHSLYPDALE